MAAAITETPGAAAYQARADRHRRRDDAADREHPGAHGDTSSTGRKTGNGGGGPYNDCREPGTTGPAPRRAPIDAERVRHDAALDGSAGDGTSKARQDGDDEPDGDIDRLRRGQQPQIPP